MRYSLNGHIVADSDAPILRWWGIPAACPADIRSALAENPADEEFVLEINSGGGSVFAGFEMYSLLRNASRQGVHTRAEVLAEDRLLNLMVYPQKKPSNNPFQMLLAPQNQQNTISDEEKQRLSSRRDEVREQLRRGELEDTEIEIEVAEKTPELEVGGNSINLGDMMGGLMPPKTKQRRVKVKEARKILIAEEAEKLIDQDAVQEEAIRRAEQNGIVFLDEIDKIAGRSAGGHGPDVSREGVQRDILPIVEGSTVSTKYGPVKTDFMLFIAAGAFHVAKVTDLIPELQGRFPVHVQLKSLTREDFVNILSKPDNALTRQYAALLETDKVHLTFEDNLYGPPFEPLGNVIVKEGLCPRIICESDGTMAEDALTMKRYWQSLNG